MLSPIVRLLRGGTRDTREHHSALPPKPYPRGKCEQEGGKLGTWLRWSTKKLPRGLAGPKESWWPRRTALIECAAANVVVHCDRSTRLALAMVVPSTRTASGELARLPVS